MGVSQLILVCAALLPAIVLCIYVFKKDRVEKEPIGLLIRLLIYGAVSCFPAAFIEGILGGFIDQTFGGGSVYVYTFVTMFFGVALVEEGCKWIGLNWLTRKNPEFNCLFDGMIYSIFVSLGFAALENVLYVLSYGIGNAIMRAVLSVPGHMFFAVLMGYYYSRAHITEKAAYIEADLVQKGYITQVGAPFSAKRDKFMSVLMPIVAHGTYNFCCSIPAGWASIALVAVVVYLYIHCFGRIKRMSASDGDTTNYAIAMVVKKYPSMSGRLHNGAAEEPNPTFNN